MNVEDIFKFKFKIIIIFMCLSILKNGFILFDGKLVIIVFLNVLISLKFKLNLFNWLR